MKIILSKKQSKNSFNGFSYVSQNWKAMIIRMNLSQFYSEKRPMSVIKGENIQETHKICIEKIKQMLERNRVENNKNKIEKKTWKKYNRLLPVIKLVK